MMQYVELGNTGYHVSRLGFGSMRLPRIEIGGEEYVDVERAVAVLQRAFDLGVNYVDSGFMYCSQESELVLGEAMAHWPRCDEIVVTDKCTKFRMKNPGDLRRNLEHQLWRMRREWFDFYLFHGIGWANWHEIDERTGWIKDMLRAKEEGLVRHIGFSFHDEPENMRRLIDEGLFELVTCQYNYLDRRNEQAMAYAKDKGLAVVVMGPVGGGRLAVIPKGLRERGDLANESAAELALRFVLASPSVSVALSGMSTMAMVEQNAAAVDKGPLSHDEIATIADLMTRNRQLADLYCTGCQYCLPCPNGVNIPRAFELYNYYTVYGLEEYATEQYASKCVECGTCLDRCPQHIDIPTQLDQVRDLFERA